MSRNDRIKFGSSIITLLEYDKTDVLTDKNGKVVKLMPRLDAKVIKGKAIKK